MAATSKVKGDGGFKTLQLVSDFLLEQLDKQKLLKPDSNSPLFVGMQGPQGCGKSHLCSNLPSYLASLNPPIRAVTLGLDDLYLPHSSLKSLHLSNPSNKLWNGRGQPGTHDLPLAEKCIQSLKVINNIEGKEGKGGKTGEREGEEETGVKLPIFDKSLFGGEGDRSHETVSVSVKDASEKVDIVILEGWMCGFPSLSTTDLTKIYEEAIIHPEIAKKWGYDKPFFLDHALIHLIAINDCLKNYEKPIWRELDCFVKLCPVEIGYTWNWRLEQEHSMKAKNGGKGMTDEQVKDFIARYMPGYELFLQGVHLETNTWFDRGIKITMGMSRDVVKVEHF